MASRYVFGQGLDPTQVCFTLASNSGTGAKCRGRFVGQLQPYALYVPKSEPAGGYGLTLLLHSLSANYNQYSASRNQSQLGDRAPGSLVITPNGRGPDGFYAGVPEADTFEVWADVARHYRIDPSLVDVSGYSMGGFGTYRLLARWPDLFARGFSVVGAPGSVGRPARFAAQHAAADVERDRGRAGEHPDLRAGADRRGGGGAALRGEPLHGGRPPDAGHERLVPAGGGVPRRPPCRPGAGARDLRGRRQRGQRRGAGGRRPRVLAVGHHGAQRGRGGHDRRALGGVRRRRSEAGAGSRRRRGRWTAARTGRCRSCAASRRGPPRRPRRWPTAWWCMRPTCRPRWSTRAARGCRARRSWRSRATWR